MVAGGGFDSRKPFLLPCCCFITLDLTSRIESSDCCYLFASYQVMTAHGLRQVSGTVRKMTSAVEHSCEVEHRDYIKFQRVLIIFFSFLHKDDMMEKGQKGELGGRVTTLLIISPNRFISALYTPDFQFIPLDQTPGYCAVSTRVSSSPACFRVTEKAEHRPHFNLVSGITLFMLLSHNTDKIVDHHQNLLIL